MKVNVELFTQTMSSLLSTSLTLQDSLKIGKEISNNKDSKKFYGMLYKKIDEGFPLSSALQEFEKYFSNFYISLVKIGEETGTLPQVFDKLSEYLKNKKEMKNKIIQSLIYPVIVLFTALIAVLIILFFVFPRLIGIFEAFNETSSDITYELENIKLKIYIVSIILFSILFLVIFTILLYKSNKRIKYLLDAFILKVPFLGNQIMTLQTHDFSFAMKILTDSHFSFTENLKLSSKVVSNLKYRDSLENVYKDVCSGNAIGMSFEKQKIFPSYLTVWINVAEANGNPEKVFSQVYEYYRKESENLASLLSTSIEPVFILLTGVIIIWVIVQFVIPIFRIMGTL